MKTKTKLLRIAAITLSLTLCMGAAAYAVGCSSSSSSDNSSASTDDNSSTDNNTSDPSGETPPEKPDGDMGGGNGETPPDKPDGDMGGGNGGGGGSSSSVSYTAATTYTEDSTSSNETFTSTGTDEEAILISSDISVTLNNPTITRTSSDSTGGDNSSFYGVGAALLATDGTAYVKGGTITTNAKGGAGAFAYGDGVVYIKDTVISTALDTSGGIHAAGGGTLYAWDLNVTTQGGSSAAIRSDRGGGTMRVYGGTYTSNGSGSPAVYCTADIQVSDATLTANGSEGICIEGRNSLKLFDCELTATMSDDSQNDTTWGIIVYQSMSGDSEVGNSTFYMEDGSLNVKNGGVIYTTNTECDIYLANVEITEADGCEFFLMCTGNTNQRGWGTSGANGSDCDFTAYNQTMTGDVIWDSISELDFYMTGVSTLTGAVRDDETYAGNGGSGYCNVYISSDSKWVVTGNSTLTNLYNAGSIVDKDGKTVTIVANGETVVAGDSEYTVTVTGSYTTAPDFTNAYTAEKKEEITLPAELSD